MMSKGSAILFGQPYYRPGHNQLNAYAWDESLLGMVFCFWLANAINYWLYILSHVLFFFAHHFVRMELLFLSDHDMLDTLSDEQEVCKSLVTLLP